LLGLTIMVLLVPTIIGGTCGVTLPPPVDNTGDGDGDGTTPEVGVYVGAARCLQCHANIHQNWAATNHSGALGTLAAIGQDTNAACLPCHTVGFGETGGFVDATTTASLAGVQCESCHGGALEHVQNVSDETLRPVISIAADVCGKCHTGAHHPTMDEWSESGHAHVTESIAEELEEGTRANSCGECHSGDARFAMKIKGETIAADFLKGKHPEEQNGITCAMCHNPHARTGNAVTASGGKDYQLRYAQVTHPQPINETSTITNAERYNLCGQCHHDRGTVWTATSRGSHHSIQSNVYIGEMPVPTGTALLVPNIRSAHRFVPGQCSTCHMHSEAFVSEEEPANTGHHFEVNTGSCSAVGCHPDEADAVSVTQVLQAEVQAKLDNILARLGDPATWEYSTAGGPSDQKTVSDTIKKVRFLMNYASYDGSKGVHNPSYVRTILTECDRLLTSVGK
jgi:hypothetical protein